MQAENSLAPAVCIRSGHGKSISTISNDLFISCEFIVLFVGVFVWLALGADACILSVAVRRCYPWEWQGLENVVCLDYLAYIVPFEACANWMISIISICPMSPYKLPSSLSKSLSKSLSSEQSENSVCSS